METALEYNNFMDNYKLQSSRDTHTPKRTGTLEYFLVISNSNILIQTHILLC